MEIVGKLIHYLGDNKNEDWTHFLKNLRLNEKLKWKFQVDSNGIGLFFEDNFARRPIKVGGKSVLDSKKGVHPILNLINRQKDLSNGVLIDVTGGLLNDTYLLLSSGNEVWTFESNPLLSIFIITNHLLKTRNQKMKFKFIPNFFSLEMFSSHLEKYNKKIAIYDPMFFEKAHKSLSNSSMQTLYQLDSDFPVDQISKTEWVNWKKFFDLIVVKRPDKAKNIFDQVPHFSLSGKLIRWDVYIKS